MNDRLKQTEATAKGIDLSINSNRILVMTVGTGDLTRLEESLFVPLRKSIATDAWTQVILLPSQATEAFAETVRNGIQGVKAAVRPLPEGDENDADRAYAHFDSVLAEALRETPPEDIVVDFTRGTKAMSAALVLAAARREIPQLRYITGRRDERGMVIAGSEEVRGVRTTIGAGHRRLDLAHDLMRRGNFMAAGAVLPDTEHPTTGLYPDDLIEIATAVRIAARFYAAWDRLDYAAASGMELGGPPDSDWKELWPTSVAQKWVAVLAEGKELRRLIVDLLANGERRLRQGQHEDALVRAYRVLELIGPRRGCSTMVLILEISTQITQRCRPCRKKLERKTKSRSGSVTMVGFKLADSKLPEYSRNVAIRWQTVFSDSRMKRC